VPFLPLIFGVFSPQISSLEYFFSSVVLRYHWRNYRLHISYPRSPAFVFFFYIISIISLLFIWCVCLPSFDNRFHLSTICPGFSLPSGPGYFVVIVGHRHNSPSEHPNSSPELPRFSPVLPHRFKSPFVVWS
jgi:hypothetical protein